MNDLIDSIPKQPKKKPLTHGDIIRQMVDNHWISCSEKLPDMRNRVLVTAVRNREHYPKDTEPSRMFIAMRIEMLSDGEWYWASATDMYGYDGIGGMLALGGWNVVAWMPMPDAYKPLRRDDANVG